MSIDGFVTPSPVPKEHSHSMSSTSHIPKTTTSHPHSFSASHSSASHPPGPVSGGQTHFHSLGPATPAIPRASHSAVANSASHHPHPASAAKPNALSHVAGAKPEPNAVLSAEVEEPSSVCLVFDHEEIEAGKGAKSEASTVCVDFPRDSTAAAAQRKPAGSYPLLEEPAHPPPVGTDAHSAPPASPVHPHPPGPYTQSVAPVHPTAKPVPPTRDPRLIEAAAVPVLHVTKTIEAHMPEKLEDCADCAPTATSGEVIFPRSRPPFEPGWDAIRVYIIHTPGLGPPESVTLYGGPDPLIPHDTTRSTITTTVGYNSDGVPQTYPAVDQHLPASSARAIPTPANSSPAPPAKRLILPTSPPPGNPGGNAIMVYIIHTPEPGPPETVTMWGGGNPWIPHDTTRSTITTTIGYNSDGVAQTYPANTPANPSPARPANSPRAAAPPDSPSPATVHDSPRLIEVPKPAPPANPPPAAAPPANASPAPVHDNPRLIEVPKPKPAPPANPPPPKAPPAAPAAPTHTPEAPVPPSTGQSVPPKPQPTTQHQPPADNPRMMHPRPPAPPSPTAHLSPETYRKVANAAATLARSGNAANSAAIRSEQMAVYKAALGIAEFKHKQEVESALRSKQSAVYVAISAIADFQHNQEVAAAKSSSEEAASKSKHDAEVSSSKHAASLSRYSATHIDGLHITGAGYIDGQGDLVLSSWPWYDSKNWYHSVSGFPAVG